MGALRAARSTCAGVLLATLATCASAAETNVRFSLGSRFEGPSALFVLPFDKGYYKAEGLNVGIESTLGLMEPITRVASGDDDMGFADINALIKFRDANPGNPVKAVFIVYNRAAYAVVGRKSRGVNTPKDLEGKKLGAPANGGAFEQWPIFAKANGIDTAKVAIENISFPVREPMLAAGQVDAATGNSFTTFINLKDKGVPVNDISLLLMADYGVDLYGNAIIVNPKFAAAHPDAVKGFLRAFTKSLKETVKSPAAAIGSALKRNENARKETELERLSMAIRDNIVTPEVKANGYGGIDAARFARAIDLIASVRKFKTKPTAADIFDDSFLPPAEARKF